MKCTVDGTEFTKALKEIKPAVAGKTTLPILECVQFLLQGNELKLHATNLDVFMEIVIPVESEVDGSAIVNYKEMLAFKYTENMIIEHTDNGKLRMGNARLRCVPEDEFPDNAFTFTEPSHQVPDLAKALKECRTFASKEETRHFLNGIFVHLNTGAALAATDGKRLRTLMLNDTKYDELSCIIPSEAINAIQMLGGNVGLGIDNDGRITLKSDNKSLICRKVEGEYPDYKAVLKPINYETTIKLNRAMFLTAINMVYPHKTPSQNNANACKKNSLLFRFGPQTIIQYADGEIESEFSIPAECNYPEPIEIRTKYIFMYDALSTIPDEFVTLALRDGLSAIRIDSKDRQDVVMPMR